MQGPGQWSVQRLVDEEERGRRQEQGIMGKTVVRAQQTQSLLLQNRGGNSQPHPHFFLD